MNVLATEVQNGIAWAASGMGFWQKASFSGPPLLTQVLAAFALPV